MKTITKCKVQALSNHFELACIAGIVVILGDMAWLVHDVIVNGVSGLYLFVFTALSFGLIVTSYVVIVHNAAFVKETRKALLENKLFAVKRAVKHNKTKKV